MNFHNSYLHAHSSDTGPFVPGTYWIPYSWEPLTMLLSQTFTHLIP